MFIPLNNRIWAQRAAILLVLRFSLSLLNKSIESSCRLNIIWKTTANTQLKKSFSTSISFQYESVSLAKRAKNYNLFFFSLKNESIYEFIFWQCMKKVAPFQNCALVWCVYSVRSHFTHSNRNVYHKLIFNCIKNECCVWCEKLVYALPWFLII